MPAAVVVSLIRVLRNFGATALLCVSPSEVGQGQGLLSRTAGALFLIGTLWAANGLGAEPPPALFSPFGAIAVGSEAALRIDAPHPGVPRRLVQVEWALLEQARRQVEQRGEAALLFNLSDAAALPVVFEHGAPTKSGYSLAGRIADASGGRVVLAVNGELLAGAVWTPQANYRIRSLGGGLHSIERVDATAAPPLAEPWVPPLERRAEATEVPTSAEAGMAQIDLLILWTPAARRLVGGLRRMQTKVDLAVAVANDAYATGGVAQRLRLVGATEIDYEDATLEDISRLPEKADGFLDELHEIRDGYAADLVSLFVRFEVGGIASLMAELSPAFAPFAFSMVDVRAADTILAHELGHNMGLQHDRYVVPTDIPPDLKVALFPYSFGYVNQRAFAHGSPCWHSIMAYPDQCDDAGLLPVGLPRFSNPDQNHPPPDGDPLGVPVDQPAIGWDGPAHAVRSLNEARQVVAGFRDAAERCAYPLSSEEITLPAGGGDFSIRVDAEDGCPWTAHHQSGFLGLATGGTHTGSGEVAYRAQPNDGLARAGLASIGGEVIAVRQLGAMVPAPVCQRTPAVRDAIAGALSKEACDAVTVWDLGEVTALSLRGRSIAALRPDDFQGLVNLWRLELSEAITDLTPLAGLVNLGELSLFGNGVADLAPLANLVQIEYLTLDDNAIADLDPLAGLTRLLVLSLTHNRVEDLAPLAGLTELLSLDLTGNAVSDLSPLAGLGNLFVLFLGDNQVKEVAALAGLERLLLLDLADNAVEDISPLLALQELRQLDLRGNPLSDAALEVQIPTLQSRGVLVLFDEPEAPLRRPSWWWFLTEGLVEP